MSASRTLRNKMGRDPGPIAASRLLWPIARAKRMATPFNTVSVRTADRVKLKLAALKAERDRPALVL